ncbi:MAG: type II toxin-antitoxin system RelE/ParE family toxin [Proteobacteria bacterium]|nr:type II toxin-antitoxin system RelE/ParE family toxin [Pseudomonadota bacterium]
MEFIETTGFSSIRENYFDDSQFNMLQLYLMDRPDAGSIIRGSGGVRKLRWGLQGKGKRGGVRVVYYWITKHQQILFLTAYAKNEAANLSRDSIRSMREIVKDL